MKRENLQNGCQHDSAGYYPPRKLCSNKLKLGVLEEHPLPDEERYPAETAQDEDGDGRGAAPGIVPDGGLVDYEDGKHSSCQDQHSPDIIEVPKGYLDKELVVVWPDEEQHQGRDKGTRAAATTRLDTRHLLARPVRLYLLDPKDISPADICGKQAA